MFGRRTSAAWRRISVLGRMSPFGRCASVGRCWTRTASGTTSLVVGEAGCRFRIQPWRWIVPRRRKCAWRKCALLVTKTHAGNWIFPTGHTLRVRLWRVPAYSPRHGPNCRRSFGSLAKPRLPTTLNERCPTGERPGSVRRRAGTFPHEGGVSRINDVTSSLVDSVETGVRSRRDIAILDSARLGLLQGPQSSAGWISPSQTRREFSTEYCPVLISAMP